MPPCAEESSLAKMMPVTLTVSAASNLMPALEEIGGNFTQETGVELAFNFGASTQLAQQILQGAPVDVFLSAGQAEIDLLLAENRLLAETVTPFARGRLVLWQPEGDGEQIAALSGLLQPHVRRIAIANPAYAPYGAAARQALQSQGLWDALADKIVYGSTASHALQMAETGGVDAALTALSLSLTAAALAVSALAVRTTQACVPPFW